MILTLKELAEYLRVNERTILRMVNKGKIQGTKIGGQWRFNGSQIDQVFFSHADLEAESEEEKQEVQSSSFARPYIGIPLSRVMSESRMIMKMQAETVEDVINEMTDARLLYGLALDVTELREKCIARENVLSTGIGGGFAIPHPRDPIPTLRAPVTVIYGYSEKGVAYNAPDGEPIHHFFLICSQNIELHLHLMGCMARLLKDENFTKALPGCKKPEEVLKLVMEHERSEMFAQQGEKDGE